MIEWIKNFWGYLAVVVFLILIFFYSCNIPHPKDTIIVPTGVTAKELVEIKKQIPDAEKAVKFIPPIAHIGKITEATIVVKKNGDVVVVNKEIIDWGWKKRFGVYLDSSLFGMGGGIKWNCFSVSRANLDVLAGFPRVSAGLSYQLFKNTSIGIGYGFNYNKLIAEPNLYLSMGF